RTSLARPAAAIPTYCPVSGDALNKAGEGAGKRHVAEGRTARVERRPAHSQREHLRKLGAADVCPRTEVVAGARLARTAAIVAAAHAVCIANLDPRIEWMRLRHVGEIGRIGQVRREVSGQYDYLDHLSARNRIVWAER